MKRYLFIDIESHNAGKQWGMTPQAFGRLYQYAINDGEVVLTSSHSEMIDQIRAADYVVGHNIIAFDLTALFGKDSLEPLIMAQQRKIIDTFVLASLVTPAPNSYEDSKGHRFFDASKPGTAMKWLSLSNLCFQFGLPGKFGSLQDLAKKYNPPKTLVRDLDYSLIPLDDEDFREYARQDIIAVRGLYHYLLTVMKGLRYSGEYVWREMEVVSINAQITRNGVLVDQESAAQRVAELEAQKNEIMDWLVKEFEFPTEGKAPWKSDAGKASILKALESYGIKPERNPAWTRTAGGAPSFGGEVMLAITAGTDAEDLGIALATLQGQRSLAALALESTYEDGRIHPEITCLQRSGRTSVQRPGLTVWTARGPGAVEKRYFIADPGSVMVEMDYAAADARAVAAVSGDEEFAKRFEEGVDSHDLTGEIFWGYEIYHANRKELRPTAKIGGHALAYRIGVRKLAVQLGVTLEQAAAFIDNYKATYRFVARWQEEVTREGDKGFVTNTWGRRMTVDPDRSFNQSSALIGQSTTREILFDGLIRIARDNIDVIRWLRMTVHDAVVWSIPITEVSWAVPFIKERMETVYDPGTSMSQPIAFPMSVGPLTASNWYEASHE